MRLPLRRVVAALTLLLACSGAAVLAQGRAARVVAPAALRDGALPPLPALALGGGEVIVELSVSERGAVTAVRPLRGTVPYTDVVVAAVGGWQFTPAEELLDPADRKPGEGPTRAVPSRVLVAALFRPPSFYAGTTLGEPIVDVDRPSDDAPFPIATSMPSYSPVARDSGVVLVEARIESSGVVSQATVKRSRAPFDDAALDAVRGWRFRPARIAGSAAMSRAYLLFGFRMPDGNAVGRR